MKSSFLTVNKFLSVHFSWFMNTIRVFSPMIAFILISNMLQMACFLFQMELVIIPYSISHISQLIILFRKVHRSLSIAVVDTIRFWHWYYFGCGFVQSIGSVSILLLR